MSLPAKQEGVKAPLAEIAADPFMGRIDLDGQELRVIHDYFNRMRYHPVATHILDCKGHACEFAPKCPLARLNKLPEPGSDCPVELALIELWVSDIVQELGIDPEDVIDQAQVRELIAVQLYDKRIGEKMADRPLLVDAFRSMTLDGQAITEEKLNPLYLAIERNHKMRDRILQSMIATREAKSHDKTRTQLTADQYAATLMKRAQLMRKELEVQRDLDKAKPVEASVTSVKSVPAPVPEPPQTEDDEDDEEYDPDEYEDVEVIG